MITFRKFCSLLGVIFLLAITTPQRVHAQSDDFTISVATVNACLAYIEISVNKPNVTYKWYVLNETTGAFDLIPDQNRRSLADILPGKYKVEVTNLDTSEVIDAEYTLTESFDLRVADDFSGLICDEDADSGAILLYFENGTSPYTYSLTNVQGNTNPITGTTELGELTVLFEGLTSGDYIFEWIDDNGCSGNTQIVVEIPDDLIVTATKNDAVCFGGSGEISFSVQGGWGSDYKVKVTNTTLNTIIPLDGFSTITASGGNTFYNVGNGQNIVLSGLSAGIYELEFYDDPLKNVFLTNNFDVTQNNSCNNIHEVEIEEPDELVILDVDAIVNNVSCFEGDDGSIQINPTGGTPPYNFTWAASNGGAIPAGQGTTDTLTDLSPGNYQITVTDDNGCQYIDTYTIDQPTQLTLAYSSSSDVSCNGGSDGSITVEVSGGTPNYTFSINGAVISPTSVTGDLYTFSGLIADDYTLTVTDTNNCESIQTQVIREISEPPAITHTISDFELDCFGDTNGVIDGTISGGTPPYTITNNDISGTTVSVTTDGGSFSFNGLAAENYTFTITDDKGCTTTASANVTQPNQITAATIKTDVSCFGDANGSIDGTITGGTAPYTITNNITAQVTNVATDGGNFSITGLIPGTYNYTIEDSKGCTIPLTHTIDQPTQLTLASSSSSDVSCNGGSDGSITVEVSGGTPNYTFSINGAVISPTSVTGDLYTFSGLIADDYTLTVTDTNNCTSDLLKVEETIGEPQTITNTISNFVLSCFGDTNGVINGTISGGTPPYTITNDISGTTVSVTTDGGSFSFNGLAAGNYTFTIRDKNSSTNDAGCTTTASANVTQPNQITAATIKTDVSCFGDANGSIDGTITGGTAPYTITNNTTAQVTNVATDGGNFNITGLIAGTYNYTIEDDNGCTIPLTHTIDQPNSLGLSSNISTFDSGTGSTINISCNGNSDGYINITPVGGTAPFTYQWTASNGGNINVGNLTNQNQTGLVAGEYEVVVTDSKNCTFTENFTLNEPRILSGSATVTKDNECYDGSLGAIQATIDGTGSVDGINYSYVISGANIPAGYNSSISSTQLTQEFNNLPAGTYTVTVTDENNCNFTSTTQTISQPSSPITASETISNFNGFSVSCFGSSNAALILSVSGGTPSIDSSGNPYYTYQWTSPSGSNIPTGMENTSNLSGIGAGTYSVVITDSTGSCTLTETYTITQPDDIVLTGTTSNYNGFEISAFGLDDGSINLTVAGGIDTQAYTYSWSASNGGAIPTGQGAVEDPSGLTAGTYTVVVTDANGCTETLSFTLEAPDELLVSENIAAHQNVDCFGDSTGIIQIDITQGSVGPYDYNLNLAGTVVETKNTTALNYRFENLVAGNYNATVVDANGSSVTVNNIIISQPTSGLAFASETVSDANGFGISCFDADDGTIDLVISGGTPPYTYNWTASNGTDLSTINSPNLNALAPGDYTVVITDSTGSCTLTETYTITQPDDIVLTGTTSNYNGFEISAFGLDDGSINLTVAGGIDTQAYTYSWSASNGGAIPTGQGAVEDPSGLTAGTYTVLVTDANGCTETIPFNLEEPNELLVTEDVAQHQNVDCFGDSTGIIQIDITQGSVGPYDYNLNLAGTVVETKNTTALNYRFENLVAGNYNATVVDANGSSVTVNNIIISQPTSGLAFASETVSDANGFGISCFGADDGTIDLVISGGTPPYTYSWTASNGTDLSTINSPNLNALAPGDYTVVITDGTGNCSITETYTITQPDDIVLTGTTSNYNGFEISAFGLDDGSINLTVAGGIDTQAYTYSWSASNGGAIPTGQGAVEDPSGLTEGNYTVLVTDANGCTETLDFELEAPDELLVSENIAAHQNVDCFGDSTGVIQIDITQGSVGPYDYNLNLAGTVVETKNTTALNYRFENLVAGNYNATVVDANGSSVTVNNIIISQPTSAFTASITTSSHTGPNGTFELSCFGSSEGVIDISLSGGIPFNQGLPTAYYNYILTNSSGTIVTTGQGTTINETNLFADTYILNATDETGNCVINEVIVLSEPDPLIITTDFFQDMSCFQADDGAISVTVSGGLGNYLYNWTKDGSPFATTDDLSALDAGQYVLVVEDTGTNACSVSETYIINEPLALQVSLDSKTDILCNGDSTGAINVSVSGGTTFTSVAADYQFNWVHDSGATYITEDLSNIPAGTYDLTVTDANGCSETLQVILTEPTAVIFNPTTTDISCYGYDDGSITINPTGGVTPYVLTWSDLGNGTTRTNLSPGTYTATIVDGNNCTYIENITIVDAPIFAINGTKTNISCFGANDGSIDLTITGGVAPLVLSWNDDPTAGLQRNNLGPGVYDVTITGADGCIQAETYVIDEPIGLQVSGVTTDAFDCTDPNSGAIDITVAGGTLPLQFLWNNGATTEDLTAIPAGNYAVTVTDANSCQITENFTIIRQTPLSANVVSNIDSNCITKDVVQINELFITGGFPPHTISWSYGNVDTSDPTIMRTSVNGNAVATITDSIGCTTSVIVPVNLLYLGDADFNMDSSFFTDFNIWAINDPISFTNTSTGDPQGFNWDFGDGNTSTDENPIHSYVSEGTYQITLTVDYAYGCSYTVAYTIIVGRGYEIEMPNAFTPNGDGVNDTFRPVYLGMKEVKLEIYDTWGGLLYVESSTTNTFVGWDGTVDGKPIENGNYIYQLTATARNDLEIQKTGPFTLIK